MANPIDAASNMQDTAAIRGYHTAGGDGVVGNGHRGVVGVSDTSAGAGPRLGVYGVSEGGIGVYGFTTTGFGVVGISTRANINPPPGTGVFGISDSFGIVGSAINPDGVGIHGESRNLLGVGVGVRGDSRGDRGVGVQGTGRFRAGFFDGAVEVTGDIILRGADYAEALTTTDPMVQPGYAVVVGEDGHVHPCAEEYDTAVAGIVSGARGVKPALVLDRHDNSAHVALMGKVWCYADADAAPISPGDLLTTSSTVGHCRRVTDTARAFGAVIGKALTPLASGRGLVQALVGPR